MQGCLSATMAFLATLSFAPSVHAEIFLNVYGSAKHVEARSGLNEANYGFGLRSEDGSILYEAGAFRDSRDNLSKYAGTGYQYRFRYVGVGASAFVMSRPNYRDGNLFLGALPFLTLNAGSIITTITYIPAFDRFPQTVFVYWSMNPFISK